MLLQPEPLIHIPIYSWPSAPDYPMRAMVQQHLACLESYFAHENKYALLVTTNDRRALEIYRRALEIDPHMKRVPDLVKTLQEKVEGRDI